MKRRTIIKIWSIVLIGVIFYSLTIARYNASADPSTLGIPVGFDNALYLFMYVGGYLYLTALVALILSIAKSSKLTDTGERTRQIIGKSVVGIFLISPVVYYFLFGI
jgi:hypothetical protein